LLLALLLALRPFGLRPFFVFFVIFNQALYHTNAVEKSIESMSKATRSNVNSPSKRFSNFWNKVSCKEIHCKRIEHGGVLVQLDERQSAESAIE
jgi:hypothetical protein